MKELTHEEWMKDPTPRMMWVWDSDEANRNKRKVVYITNTDTEYPVITLTNNEVSTVKYKHCAEIAKTRRMTNRELSRWLRLNPTREFMIGKNSGIRDSYCYCEINADKEVGYGLVIRENDGEWREPLIEV